MGEFLPPQIIYGGKTDKWHPVFKFPSDWNITHSENHWANTASQMDYVKKYYSAIHQESPEYTRRCLCTCFYQFTDLFVVRNNIINHNFMYFFTHIVLLNPRK